MSYVSDSTTFNTAYILCNGPSLRGFDFINNLRGHTTFGMNAAYRYWEKIGWYPQYYSCLDEVVGISHKIDIYNLICNAEKLGIKRFFLRKNLLDELELTEHEDIVDCFENLCIQNPGIFHSKRITTGSHTLLWAAYLGFKNLILLGADAKYIEMLPEARPHGGNKMLMESTPHHNPNYFFDDYQQAGDEFNKPNPNAENGDFVHKASWDSVRPALNALDVLVVNANLFSNIDTFPCANFDIANSSIQKLRQKYQLRQKQFSPLFGFPRQAEAYMDELKILYPFLPTKNGTMLDVGAHYGESCLRFLRRGWKVYAFEPDPNVRQVLKENTLNQTQIFIDDRAVSKISGREYPWYTTPDSTGAGTMHPFSEKHVKSGKVTTVSLADFIKDHDIQHIDLLKIDAEGFDFMVLQGFPFYCLRPNFIICEFEDTKTIPLGCTTAELADILQKQGYTVYVSEWHPIIRYGIRHQWYGFRPWPVSLHNTLAWGNFIAFASPPDEESLFSSVKSIIQHI